MPKMVVMVFPDNVPELQDYLRDIVFKSTIHKAWFHSDYVVVMNTNKIDTKELKLGTETEIVIKNLVRNVGDVETAIRDRTALFLDKRWLSS